MNNSTEDKIAAGLHVVKGTIKEEVGKITDDCKLRGEGKVEKNAGKVQQQIGHAKEAVAHLKEALTEITKDEHAS